MQIDLAKGQSVIITILERKSVGLDEYGDYELKGQPRRRGKNKREKKMLK